MSYTGGTGDSVQGPQLLKASMIKNEDTHFFDKVYEDLREQFSLSLCI